MGSSPARGSSFFLGKVTDLDVLCCFALFVLEGMLKVFTIESVVMIVPPLLMQVLRRCEMEIASLGTLNVIMYC